MHLRPTYRNPKSSFGPKNLGICPRCMFMLGAEPDFYDEQRTRKRPQIIEMIVLSSSVVGVSHWAWALLTHRGRSAISDIRGTLASAHHHRIIISRRKSFRHQKRQDKNNIRHQKRQDKKNIRHQKRQDKKISDIRATLASSQHFHPSSSLSVLCCVCVLNILDFYSQPLKRMSETHVFK